MAWSLIADIDAGSAGGGTVTSGNIDTTGATLLVAAVASFNTAAEPTLSDSKGNTWTSAGAAQSSGGTNPARLHFWYVNSNTPTVGSGHNVTLTGSGTFGSVEFMAFAPSLAAPLDQFSTAAATGAGTVQAGPITPTVNGALVISSWSHLAGTTSGGVIDSGFTRISNRNYSSGNHYPIYVGWIEQAVAAAIDPSWTEGMTNNAIQLVSFKPALITGPPSDGLLVSP